MIGLLLRLSGDRGPRRPLRRPLVSRYRTWNLFKVRQDRSGAGQGPHGLSARRASATRVRQHDAPLRGARIGLVVVVPRPQSDHLALVVQDRCPAVAWTAGLGEVTSKSGVPSRAVQYRETSPVAVHR
jgi:hypothetical protein